MMIEKKVPLQLVCFSHLPWKFVYQRPQHLISRFTKKYAVYYIEEFTHSSEEDGYSINKTIENVTVIVPHLCNRVKGAQNETKRKEIVLKNLFKAHAIQSYVFWYYTPMALAYTANFKPLATVYDCMDELSAFKFAPPELKTFEQQLFKKANIVFTGGNNLYKAKRHSITTFILSPAVLIKPILRRRETSMKKLPTKQLSPILV